MSYFELLCLHSHERMQKYVRKDKGMQDSFQESPEDVACFTIALGPSAVNNVWVARERWGFAEDISGKGCV